MTELVGAGEPDDAWPTETRRAAAESTGAAVARHTETTRYLCAATHLHEKFADLVIGTLLEQPHRALAPAYGVDLLAVARHALVARRRRWVRDVALLVLLGVFVALLAWRLTPPATRHSLEGWDGQAARTLLHAIWPALLVLAAAWLVVAADIWTMRARVIPGLSRERFDIAARLRVRPRTRAQLEAIARSQAGNVVVFSGWSPFVGSGLLVEDWSFAIDVRRGKRDQQTNERRSPTPFDAAALHRHMAGALTAVGLPALRVQQRLFVDGFEVRKDRDLLEDPYAAPRTEVDDDVVLRSLRSVESAARTYLCVEATGWHGHLVVTMFFRAVCLEGSLFIEGASFVLLPLKNEYYGIDAIERQGMLEASVRALQGGAVRMIPLVLWSPVRIGAGVRHSIATHSRQRRFRSLVAEGCVLDYGATTSIREVATGSQHNRYFLRLDHEMYVKVASERVLQSISEFLDQHGVDTAEFSVYQTTINQNRVHVSAAAGSQVAVAGGNQRGLRLRQSGAGGGPKPAERE